MGSQFVFAASLSSVTGHPANANVALSQAGLYRLELNRPVSAVRQEPTVAMTVDIALDPAAIAHPFYLIQDKGAWYATTFRLSYVDGDHTTLLRQVYQTVEHARFAIDLTPLMEIEPYRAEIPAEPTSRTVWAHYYPWYMPENDWMWWTNPKWTDHPMMRYDSSDPHAIALQIAQAQSAGIGGFLCEWLGTQDPGARANDRNLRLLLDIAQRADFAVAASFDMAFTAPRPPTAQEVQSGLAYLISSYRDHPAYAHVNGKPLIVLFGTSLLPLDTWRNIIARLRDQGLEATYLADGYALSNLDVFDGLHEYTTFGYSDPSQIYLTLSRSVHYYPLLRSGTSPRFWAASVTPGFDNTPLVRELGASLLFVDRRGGDYYREQLQAAILTSADWIFITSWNEFQENTHIEPSDTYADMYLQITRQFADQWTGR